MPSHAPPTEIHGTGNVGRDLSAGLPEAFDVAGHDRDIDATTRAVALSLASGQNPFAPLQDRGHLVVTKPGHAATVHPGGRGKGHGRDHPRGSGRSDHPARMQDVGEDPARAGEDAGERVCDRPQDEPPRCELGEIGQQRSDEVAEVQFASLHELANRVLGRLEGADEALADVAADVAGLGGVVRQRRGNRLPPGDGSLGRGLRGSGGRTGRRTSTCGGATGIAECRLQPLGRTGGLGQRIGAVLIGAAHRIAQGLPAFEWGAGPFRQIARGAAIEVRGLERPVGRLGQTEIGCGQRIVLEGPIKGRLCRGGRCSRRPLETVLDLAEVEIGHQRDLALRSRELRVPG